MVINFEEHTSDLNDKELGLLEPVNRAFNHALPHGKTLKSALLCDDINYYLYKQGIDYNFNAARLRKWVNYLRSGGILPVMATSNGYSIETRRDKLESQIKSLRQRANSINNAADGLQKLIKDI